MTQYIDKAAVVAEIERRISNHNKELQHASDEDFVSSWASDEENQKLALTALIPFLNTLELKEVDLGKELDSYFAKFKGLEKNNWNWRTDSMNIHAQGIYDFAKHFFELGLKAQKGE